jgi:hypothetical protein
MPIPSVLVTRFFQLLLNRQFAEAERELERLKQKMQKTEWNRGYFRALHGMFLSRKANGDQYAFFSIINIDDEVALLSYRREFSNHVKSKLHGDFDRGFFSAWADCMRVLRKIASHKVIVPPSASGATSEEEKPQITEPRESQATMETFLEGKKLSGRWGNQRVQ